MYSLYFTIKSREEWIVLCQRYETQAFSTSILRTKKPFKSSDLKGLIHISFRSSSPSNLNNYPRGQGIGPETIKHQHLVAKRIKRAEFQLRFFDRLNANFILFGIVGFRRLCTFDLC